MSGISGSFIGASYSTNNFLGLGETLSLSAQIGTLLDNVTFGFTEPYLFDKPVQTGFTVFYQRYSYNQGQQASILAGTNLIGYYNQLGTQNLLNYVTNGKGFTTFVSYQLRRSFARVGLTYSFRDQSVTPITDAAKSYFNYLDFEGVGGPNTLSRHQGQHRYAHFRLQHGQPSNYPDPRSARELWLRLYRRCAGRQREYRCSRISISLISAAASLRAMCMGFHVNARFIAGYGGRGGASLRPLLHGWRKRHPRLRYSDHQPDRLYPNQPSIAVLNNDGTSACSKGYQFQWHGELYAMPPKPSRPTSSSCPAAILPPCSTTNTESRFSAP